MNLDEAQRKQVAAWVAEGLKLSDIQNRLASELGVRMTYMEVRFLVDDLKLTPKDVEPTKPAGAVLPATGTPPADKRQSSGPSARPRTKQPEPAAAPVTVSVSVDQIARAGAVVSGKVTFSDGNKAEWYLDQKGRLGLATEQPGYRPPAADLKEFQIALESELSKLGF
jgi:hypothetical protein